MKVLVTGANGFIGQAVCQVLENSGIEIIKIYGKKKSLESVDKNPSNKNEFSVDLTNRTSFSDLEELEGISALVHCAGLAHQHIESRKKEFDSVNVEALVNTLEYAQKKLIKKFILISSVSVYGLQTNELENKPIDETAECKPKGFYALSKLEGEKKAVEFCLRHNVELIIFRPATVIGEGDPGNLLKLIKFLLSNKFFWIGNGQNKKSFLYKNEVGRAVLTVLQTGFIKSSKAVPSIYNLTSKPLTMREIVGVIENSFNLKPARLIVSSKFPKMIFRINDSTIRLKLLTAFSNKLEKWLSDEIFSAEKFNKDYGFIIEVEVKEAIKNECQWYLKQIS